MPCPPCRPRLPQPHPACPHTRRSPQLCPKEGKGHLQPPRRMDSCTCRPRCGGPPRTQPGHSPADSRWPQCSCTSSFEKPRPRSRRAGGRMRGGATAGAPAQGGHGGGAVGAGPPFDPKERGPPTKHSLLLSHSTNEVSGRRRRKQAATFWRNRDQVRARRLRPSPAAPDPGA